ncbi:Alanine racemase [Streptococcus constellatus]|nr:Alanine racemase [Streptococcus constellatus]
MKTSNHRPTKAIVDLAAIQFNIKQIVAHIPDNVEKWAVVKADAYGHGAVAVTQSIESIVDGFCVSNIDEAVELREAAILKKFWFWEYQLSSLFHWQLNTRLLIRWLV